MKYIVVDVESDGPIIGYHSMVCFGAVLLDNELNNTFYGQTQAIELINYHGEDCGMRSTFVPEALAISGFTREEHLAFPHPEETMKAFAKWLEEVSDGDRVTLLSDNNGYDASWINYYFHRYIGSNPFGWTSRRIGDMFCGFYKRGNYPWKKHRDNKRFPHNHHPVSDACGNATALIYLISQGFKL